MAKVKEKQHGATHEKWISGSENIGILTYEQMLDRIEEYTNLSSPENEDVKKFLLVVGNDSQKHGKEWKFSTVVAVRRMVDNTHGKGGIYFVKNEYFRNMESIKQKIITEAGLTVATAHELAESIYDRAIDVDIQLHFDLSENKSNGSHVAYEAVKKMASGSGFSFSIKPAAYGASTIADRHSK